MEATQEGSVAVPAVVLEVMCTCVHTPVTFFFPTTVRLFQKYSAVICCLFLLPPLAVISLCMPQCPFGGCLFSLVPMFYPFPEPSTTLLKKKRKWNRYWGVPSWKKKASVGEFLRILYKSCFVWYRSLFLDLTDATPSERLTSPLSSSLGSTVFSAI